MSTVATTENAHLPLRGQYWDCSLSINTDYQLTSFPFNPYCYKQQRTPYTKEIETIRAKLGGCQDITILTNHPSNSVAT